MTHTPSSSRFELPRAVSILAAVLLLASLSRAGDTQNPIDANTPPGLAAGPITGAFPLSGFESVNLFNGNVNIALPLLTVGGRGEAGYTMTLAMSSKHWTADVVCAGDRGTTCDGRYPPREVPSAWQEPGAAVAGYSPGSLQFRSAVNNPIASGICSGPYKNIDVGLTSTLTRLSFTTPDGAEHPLRDTTLYAGQLRGLNCVNTEPAPYNRGKRFISTDGLAATFESTEDVHDCFTAQCSFGATGTLYLPNGVRYAVADGQITQITDRNGNVVALEYGSQMGVTRITDSIGRVVNVAYTFDTHLGYDSINYRGYERTPREIRVYRSNLGSLLRPTTWSGGGFVPSSTTAHTPWTAMKPKQLFPNLDATADVPFNPEMVESVMLPNGKTYSFFYNPFGEIARIILPTGGMIDYEPNYDIPDDVEKLSSYGPLAQVPYILNHRVKKRRVWEDRNANPVSFKEFVYHHASNFSTFDVTVNENQPKGTSIPAGSLLRATKHWFQGNPDAVAQYSWADLPWQNGREYQTSIYDPSDTNTPVQTVTQTWEQNPCITTYPYAPIVTETSTTRDTLKWKTTYTHDCYSNVTDVYEYGFGFAPLRHRHTTYNTAYANPPMHMRTLVASTALFPLNADGHDGLKQSQTDYSYDQYSDDDPLPRPNIFGHDDDHFGSSNRTRGNCTTTTRWLLGGSIVTTARYDIAGNVIETRDGRRSESSDGLGFRTQYFYTDDYGDTAPTVATFAFPTTAINAANQVTTTRYDYDLGKPADITTPNVTTSFIRADDLDRPTQIYNTDRNGALLRKTYFYYDDTNRITTSVSSGESADPLVNDTKPSTSKTVFDGLGREVEQRSYESATTYVATQKRYDFLGRANAASNPFRTGGTPVFTTTDFDVLDRPAGTTHADGAQTIVSYPAPNRSIVRDPAGIRRDVTFDAQQRVTRVKEDPTGLGYTTDYFYDVADNLTNVSQGTQRRTFTYDTVGRLKTAQSPENGTTTFWYDENGNLRKRVDERQRTTLYSVDRLNRVTQKDYYLSDGGPVDASTPSSTYVYDNDPAGVENAVGRLVSYTSGDWKTRFDAYDPLGHVLQSTQRKLVPGGPSYEFRYEYDPGGSLTAERYPSLRKILFDHDRLARTLSATEAQTQITYAHDITYWPNGETSRLPLGNGLLETTHYNARLQPDSLTLTASGQSLWALTNQFWPVGSPATVNNGNVFYQKVATEGQTYDLTYGYDDANRIASAVAQNGTTTAWSQGYTYDPFGNRAVTSGNVLNYLTPTSLSDFDPTTNRLASTLARYDTAGNVTADRINVPPSRVFDYDAENRQIRASDGSQVARYVYDGQGNRVEKVQGTQTTTYVYDTLNRLAMEVSPDVPANEGRRYFTTDHLGSTRVITGTDTVSPILARYDYLPFGEERNLGDRMNVGDVRLKFTGKERDSETGLDNFGARYFSAAAGRFTGADPLSIEMTRIEDPQRLNLYAYVRNNPLRFTDPTGLEVNCNGTRCSDYLAWLQQVLSFKIAYDTKHPHKIVVSGNVNTKNLSEGEKRLLAAIQDGYHSVSIKAIDNDKKIVFAQQNGAEHTLAMNQIALFDAPANAGGGMTAAMVVAHETIEAYAQALDDGSGNATVAFAKAHDGAADYGFPGMNGGNSYLEKTNGGKTIIGVLQEFKILGTSNVEKVHMKLVTPLPTASFKNGMSLKAYPDSVTK